VWKKVMLGAVGLAVAFGGPIAFFTASDVWKAVRQSSSATRPGQQQPLVTAAVTGPMSYEQALPAQGHFEAPSVHDLTEVFRFDITPAWVMQRWPRVTTGLAKPQLEGYRVVLVTGTTPADLAGSLTYYFNQQQQVEQISFRGSTGDVRNLALLLTTRFNFSRRLTNDPGLVIYETVAADGRQTGLTCIRPARVLKASDPLQRFEVDVTIERPGSRG
jgi:hypothetical protein